MTIFKINVKTFYTCFDLDDHSRVKLQKGEEDYINACYLPIKEANRNYILAQVFEL